MYIWGGQQDGHYFNDLFFFNTSTFNHTPRWEQVIYASSECPQPRSGHISVIFENKLYIFGGTNGRHLFNDIWSFDLHSRVWTRIEADGFIPIARESCAAAMSDDVIYIIGGKAENGVELNDLCAYKIRSRRWFKFQNMGPSPSPRFGLTMTSVNNRLFVIGGDNENAKMEDASLIYILDCLKIKYPADTPLPQSQPSVNQTQNNNQNVNPTNNMYQQQQQTSYETSITKPLQHQKQYEQMPPQNSQEQPIQSVTQPSSPTQQQSQQYSLAATAVMNSVNNIRKDGDSSTYYSSNDSPSSPISDNSSPSSASPRHRSFFPDSQISPQQTPPVRPPRHISTVPEAALRRPRGASPLPYTESEIASDARRHYQPPISSPTPMEKQNSNLSVPDSLNANQPVDSRSSPNFSNNLTPPPRPSRDGVGLGNVQRNTVMSPTDVHHRVATSEQHDQDEIQRPKSQIPTSNSQLQYHHQPLQQPSEPISERSPNRQHDSLASPNSTSPSPKPSKSVQIQQQTTTSTSTGSNNATSTAAIQAANIAVAEERQTLLREIATRDTIISEMKKKENWWRMEVSLARKLRQSLKEPFDDGFDADEAFLMDIDHFSNDKAKLFEQLVSVKSELRRVKASISKQAQPISEKVAQADRMRTAALQEAAYFKSKYLALKAHRQQELDTVTEARCDDLEKRLAIALSENEAKHKLLQQLQKRSQHDQTARQATEERAREANQRAEEAQQAHQRALEELQLVYSRATKSEMQIRDNASKIADLTQQLRDALLASQPISRSQELAEAQLKASQLEAANLKARNDAAVLRQKLAEQNDEIARLRTLVQEREDALSEAKLHTEDYEIQLRMMREAINNQQQQQKAARATAAAVNNNEISPTKAY
ncbi:hypothetical protein BDF20DRAFT_581865 [Mycotypha africana]|uniref:uncharacterized protein n=1 Tax=Mycotypha africana TaxID=64632 RepID=UPI002300B39F|nr:uncharacterized protein BDF20DRAFT_581865 [Mycotypha africana]KAI8977696.1 hypothetical protein BDF20DRAFT_581865 [Mycotypha africana]